LEVTGIPGVGLGVAREGRLLHGEGYGLRDVGQGLAPDLDTLFFMGAAAKSFTCVAMLRLQEDGRLQVHDPVVRYLPGFRMPDAAATAQVTLHHLMTHTSGIPRLALPPGAADYGAFVDALSGQEYRPSGAPGGGGTGGGAVEAEGTEPGRAQASSDCAGMPGTAPGATPLGTVPSLI
jgi:CubicO group peptidase (beta-lactamase class C family)